jgi:excisionase family DNA binding protein
MAQHFVRRSWQYLDVDRSQEAIMAVRDEIDAWAAEPRPALLTVKQAARVLNLGRSTVYQLIADGRLEVVHIGRSTRVPADAISGLIGALRAGDTATQIPRAPVNGRA